MQVNLCTRCAGVMDHKDLHFARNLNAPMPYCRACFDKDAERRHKRQKEKEQ
jgi:hypothetical protein